MNLRLSNVHGPEAAELASVDRLEALVVGEGGLGGVLDVLDQLRELVLRMPEPDGLDVGEAVRGMLGARGDE